MNIAKVKTSLKILINVLSALNAFILDGSLCPLSDLALFGPLLDSL